MAFFLSTRLATAVAGDGSGGGAAGGDGEMTGAVAADDVLSSFGGEEPAKRLRRYENHAAELASEFEEGMVRF